MGNLLQENDVFKETFSFSQAQVDQFAEVSGDKNPIHWDEAYAATTMFKKPIIHGFLGGSVFSKILGTKFPGEGTIYMKQEMKFMKPMYVGTEYEAIITAKTVDPVKHRATVQTQVIEKATGAIVIDGEASVMNLTKI